MATTLKRAWPRLATALSGKSQAELAESYAYFQAWLTTPNQVLSLMPDREDELSGDYLFNLHYLFSPVSQLHPEPDARIEALNILEPNVFKPWPRPWSESTPLGRIPTIAAGRFLYLPWYVKQLDISQLSDSMINWYLEDF
jgi:hypothetical protein